MVTNSRLDSMLCRPNIYTHRMVYFSVLGCWTMLRNAQSNSKNYKINVFQKIKNKLNKYVY